MSVNIREITSLDIPLLQELSQKAYFPAYEIIHTREQNEFSYNEMYSTESLLNQFNVQGSRFFVISDKDEDSDKGEDKGYMALVKEEDNIWLLDKLYILPANQGKGYGKRLIQHGEMIVKEEGGETIHLKVNRRNSAVSFYKYLGYSITGEWDIEIADGKWIMDGYDMTKQIDQ